MLSLTTQKSKLSFITLSSFQILIFLNRVIDIALVKNNARIGAQIAVSLSQLRQDKGEFDC